MLSTDAFVFQIGKAASWHGAVTQGGHSTQQPGKASQILHSYDGCFQHDRTMAAAQAMSGSGRARGWLEISPDKEKYLAVIENKQWFFFSAPWMINLIIAPGLSLFSFFLYSLNSGWLETLQLVQIPVLWGICLDSGWIGQTDDVAIRLWHTQSEYPYLTCFLSLLKHCSLLMQFLS